MVVTRRLICVAVTAGMLAALSVAVGRGAEQTPHASEVLRDGFETEEPSWQREYTDTTVKLVAQERSPRAAREGRLSERFQFEAGPGSQFFVSYATPKIPVSRRSESEPVRPVEPGRRSDLRADRAPR